MKFLSNIRKNLFSIFQTALIGLLVVLVIAFVGVLAFECVEKYTSKLLDLPGKNETLKFLGIGMGGVVVALQALMSYKRAKAMEKSAEAQADAAKAQADAVSKTEQGQRQDRLKNAIEHLGHEKDSVRLGGAYELFHLAEDTEDLRQTVLDILCSHIRQTTGESKYQEKYKSKPSEEVQSLLTLLFVQEHGVFTYLPINLQGSWLNGAELSGADLRWAELSRAHLQGALLSGAHLQEAFLYDVQMQGAYLVRARLDGAYLYHAQLQRANLGVAWLRGANLWEAQLQGANLAKVQLQGAILGGVQLQGSHLFETQLHGVECEEDISGSFEQRMRKSIGQESDLSWVIFAGGLSEDDVDSLVKDLDDEKANELREKLVPHLGEPESNELPKDSGAVTGAYTKEDAEQWLVEHEKAMSEVPGDNS